jgi:hypothetical protein
LIRFKAKTGFQRYQRLLDWLRMRVTKIPLTSQKGTFEVKKSSARQRIGQLKLDLLETKDVSVSFDGEDVTANAGVLLLAQVEKLTGLIAGAAKRLDDHRTAALVKHNQFEQVMQRVLQIVSGLPAGSDSDLLRSDPAIKLGTGRNPLTGEDLSSQATQSRLETGRNFKELYRLCNWLVEYYIECHPKRPKNLVLDFDGSAIETYGLQLQAFYRSGPYRKFMYFPLFVFDQDGWLLVAALRPGDDGEVALALPVLKRLVAKLRKVWPAIRITVRADGAFTDASLYRWLDENQVGYVLGLKHNNVLLTHSRQFRQAVQKKFKRKFQDPQFTGKKGEKRKLAAIKEVRATSNRDDRTKAHRELTNRRARVIGEFRYQARTWDRERRVICRCDFDDEGLNVRYVVTNLAILTATQVYEDVYCRRARIELWIKNIKETQCDRLSCSQFKANMFRLLLHALAYLLVHQARRRLPPADQNISVTQFRRRFINVAAQIKEDRQSVSVRICATFSDAHAFRLVSKRFGAASLIAVA